MSGDFKFFESTSESVGYAVESFFDDLPEVKNYKEGKDISVYHYTTQQALFNIFQTKTILVGNILQSNDPLEIKCGLDFLKELIQSANISGLKKIVNDMVENKYPTDLFFFVFSTSQEGDSYQQWINYANRGKGVAIEFKRRHFFDSFKSMLNKESGCFYYIYPVQYYFSNDVSEKIFDSEFAKSLIDLLQKLDEFSNTNNSKTETEIKILLLILASLIKNDFHKEEKEWRYFVITKDDNPNLLPLSTKKGIQIRYKLDIDKCLNDDRFIKSVTLGPDISNSLSKQTDIRKFIEMNSRDTEIKTIEVKRSKGLIQ
jgi:hypothetical protein